LAEGRGGVRLAPPPPPTPPPLDRAPSGDEREDRDDERDHE
jgi:hypothetical protein